MNRLRCPTAVGLVCVWTAAWCAPAWGGDSADLTAAFGGDLRRVAATRDPRDDVELSGQLLTAARSAAGNLPLTAALCEKAYELAMKHPAGHVTAIDAMRLLAQRDPDRSLACGGKVVAARVRQYYAARGDERTSMGDEVVEEIYHVLQAHIAAGEYGPALKLARQAVAVANAIRSPMRASLQALLKRLTGIERADKEARLLERKLKARPEDTAARGRLVLLCVMELDDPVRAAKFLNASCDEHARTYLPLIKQAPDQLPGTVCAELGDWYRGLSAKATAAGQIAMLRRAVSYYRVYLDQGPGDDASRAKANVLLIKCQADLARLEEAGAGVWVDVLKEVKVAVHGSMKLWVREGSRVGMRSPKMFEGKGGVLTLPIVPSGSYELRVAFVRAHGTGGVGIWLPVGDKRITAILGDKNGQESHLATVLAPGQDNQHVLRPGKLTNGRENVFAAKVIVHDEDQTIEITTTLNGQKYLHWKGPLKGLARWLETGIAHPSAPAIGTLGSRLLVNSARLRMVSGTCKWARVTAADLAGVRATKNMDAAKREADRERMTRGIRDFIRRLKGPKYR